MVFKYINCLLIANIYLLTAIIDFCFFPFTQNIVYGKFMFCCSEAGTLEHALELTLKCHRFKALSSLKVNHIKV